MSTLLCYEIYPQRETPKLSQISHLEVTPFREPVYLLSDDVVCYAFFGDSLDGNFRLNHLIHIYYYYGRCGCQHMPFCVSASGRLQFFPKFSSNPSIG